MSRKDDLWDEVAKAAEDYILKAEKDSGNKLRQNYTDIMASRDWNNREFNDLVDDIVSSLRNVEQRYARSDWREIEIIDKACQIVVDGHFAASCLSDSRIERDLPDRVVRDMREAEQDYRDAVRGERNSRNDRDRDHRDSGRDDRRRSNSRDYRDNDRDRDRGAGRGRSHRGAGGTPVASGIEALFDVVDGDDRDDDRDDRREERAPERREERPARDEPEEIIEQLVAKVVDKGVEGPDYTKARPYDEYWLKGEHWQAAHLSKWKLTYDGSIESTIPKLHNVNTHIKYYVKNADNEVREELIEVTDENRYLSHQNQYEPAETIERRPSSAGIRLGGGAKANTDDGDEAPLSVPEYQQPKSVNMATALEALTTDQLMFASANPTESLAGAVFTSRARLAKEDVECRLDFHLLRTPMVASSFEQISLIDEVYDSNTLTDAFNKLNAMKPKFDGPIWERLNLRYSQALLRATRFQFQFDKIEKMSFAKHYPILLDTMAKKRDSEATSTFAGRIGFVSALACGHIAAEELASESMSDLIEDATVPTVVFADIIAIASFKGTMDQLGLGNSLDTNPNGVSITAQTHQRLNGVLRALYTNLDSQVPRPGKVRLYLSTKDNRLVEVLPYFGRPEVFILALVE